MTSNVKTEYITKPCSHCGEQGSITALVQDLIDYFHNGKLIHKAFPYLDAGQREQIITGIHSECWDVMFPEPEDEDEQSE